MALVDDYNDYSDFRVDFEDGVCTLTYLRSKNGDGLRAFPERREPNSKGQ